MFLNHLLYQQDIERISKLPVAWETLKGTNVFIIGATGMIGTCLVDVLMNRNREFGDQISIYAVGRSLERARERFQDYWDSDLFEFIPCDINQGFFSKFNQNFNQESNQELIRNFFQKSNMESEWKESVNLIFHCASNTHPNAYAAEPIRTILTNVVGTRNVLELARSISAKRVLFFSTVEIYGENRGDGGAFREADCGYIDCNTLRAGYPEGKRCGEALCQAYRQEYGMDIVIPRICRVFGPTMLPSDSKALAQFIKNSVRKEDIVLKSEGNQFFSYCYTADVVSALFYILCYGENGGAYNIADESFDIRLKELAKILAHIAGTEVVFQMPEQQEAMGFSKASTALLNSEKLKSLGWKPAYSLEEALRKTVTILREHKIKRFG